MSPGQLETPLQGPLATLWRLLSHLQPYKQYIPDSLSAVYLPGTGFRAQGLGFRVFTAGSNFICRHPQCSYRSFHVTCSPASSTHMTLTHLLQSFCATRRLCSCAWLIWKAPFRKMETLLQGHRAILWQLLNRMLPCKPDSLSALIVCSGCSKGSGFRVPTEGSNLDHRHPQT